MLGRGLRLARRKSEFAHELGAWRASGRFQTGGGVQSQHRRRRYDVARNAQRPTECRHRTGGMGEDRGPGLNAWKQKKLFISRRARAWCQRARARASCDRSGRADVSQLRHDVSSSHAIRASEILFAALSSGAIPEKERGKDISTSMRVMRFLVPRESRAIHAIRKGVGRVLLRSLPAETQLARTTEKDVKRWRWSKAIRHHL